MSSPLDDKKWASKYLLDPLNGPEPSQETGPGSHFTRPTSTPKIASSTTSKHSGNTVSGHYPTPPSSASPSRSSFHPSNPFANSPTYRQSAFRDYERSSRKNLDEQVTKAKGHRRERSLGERFPGDMSHRPLDQLRKEAKTANRAPHLRKKHIPGADLIDSLDLSPVGSTYHHEGPYDATLLARNTVRNAPVDAVRRSNAEALRATPKEHIRDALDKHVPLHGTAVIPSGMPGLDGKRMQYEEGADLMREPDAPGGAYKRWEGIKYLPEDYKGKGEPSFTLERDLKARKQGAQRTILPDGSSEYEMQPPDTIKNASRQRSASGTHTESTGTKNGSTMRYSEYESEMRRSNTTGNKIGEGLKKRFGSLRRHKKTVEA
ncbi:hypothetical protein B0O99DRAFT_685684 [Bisporella sp. PMI_857]|nr:hypothetical protein B0O99DRAFT_685684 [Bisporella sp. PMI_857]